MGKTLGRVRRKAKGPIKGSQLQVENSSLFELAAFFNLTKGALRYGGKYRNRIRKRNRQSFRRSGHKTPRFKLPSFYKMRLR